MNKESIAFARELGKTAFENGKRCVPAHDNDLLDLIGAVDFMDRKNVLRSTRLIKAWAAGWTKANLDAEW